MKEILRILYFLPFLFLFVVLCLDAMENLSRINEELYLDTICHFKKNRDFNVLQHKVNKIQLSGCINASDFNNDLAINAFIVQSIQEINNDVRYKPVSRYQLEKLLLSSHCRLVKESVRLSHEMKCQLTLLCDNTSSIKTYGDKVRALGGELLSYYDLRKPRRFLKSHALEALIRADAHLDEQDQGGYTPLLHAAADGQADVVISLVKAGANVNMQNNEGETAIMLAVLYSQNISIINVLLEAKADLAIVDQRGCTVYDYARQCNNLAIQRLLKLRPMHLVIYQDYCTVI